MRLSEFIRANSPVIVDEWAAFARTLMPFDNKTELFVLKDHAQELLQFIADDMESAQTGAEQSDKSKGNDTREPVSKDSAAEKHANLRFLDGFDTAELVAEFRAMRASVIKLWTRSGVEQESALGEMTRFNEAVDQTLAESVSRYTERLQHARDMFLGTLVHDLRNPLGAISNSAELLMSPGRLGDEQQAKVASQIGRSVKRVNQLVSFLVDLIHVRLGKGLVISPARMDMQDAGAQAVHELQALHPDYAISFESSGDLHGNWDAARIGQLLSNLLGNAVQHGSRTSRIQLAVRGQPTDVTISVHNEGKAIPAEVLPTIFDPLTRGKDERQAETASTSLGLGLFICKEIAEAHGGKIEAESSSEEGTTFMAQLPRVAPQVHSGH